LDEVVPTSSMSVASVWEMQIKIQLDKLKLSLALKELIKYQQETNNLWVSSVSLPYVLALAALSLYHKYPFDLLLIPRVLKKTLHHLCSF
jgi:PIN domain nuclease of toxin-antitoxin system